MGLFFSFLVLKKDQKPYTSVLLGPFITSVLLLLCRVAISGPGPAPPASSAFLYYTGSMQRPFSGPAAADSFLCYFCSMAARPACRCLEGRGSRFVSKVASQVEALGERQMESRFDTLKALWGLINVARLPCGKYPFLRHHKLHRKTQGLPTRLLPSSSI